MSLNGNLFLLALVADLTNDWSSRTPSDLLYTVPYTWFLSFCLKEFELVTVTNQFNWVDCSSQHQENGMSTSILERNKQRGGATRCRVF